MRYLDFKIVETRFKEQTPQNVADLATQRAALDGSTRDLPIPVEIADPVLRLAPSLRQFVTYNSTHGIVGIKTVNGNTIRRLQQSLNRAGYDLQVDGAAGNNTQAAIIDVFYKIADANGIVVEDSYTDRIDALLRGNNPGRTHDQRPQSDYMDTDAANADGNYDTPIYPANGSDNNRENDPEASDTEQGLQSGPPYPQEDREAVRAMQTKLEDLGYSVGNTGIDGKYGPRTSRAVAAFKTDNNIQATNRGRSMSQDDLATLASARKVENPTPTGNEGSSGGSGSYDLPPLSDRDDVQGAVKAVLDFIAQYESRGHYDIRNGGSRDPAILNMTVAEVQQYQRGWRRWPESASAAIGRYQYTQGTLSDYIAKMGVDANTQKFDPEFQDRLAIFDMRDRSRLDGWLNGSVSDEAFVNELSQVWAAIPNSSNQSAYRGIANNRRRIDYDDAVDIIGQIRSGIV